MSLLSYTIEDLQPYLPDLPPEPTPTLSLYKDTGRPGDDFNAQHTGAEVLAWLGFTFAYADNKGQHYTRPGKSTKQGSSATCYADGGVSIWSDTCKDMWPALETHRNYDPFGLMVVTKYGGDWEAATADLAAEGYGEPYFLREESTLIDELETAIAIEIGALNTDACGWELGDIEAAFRKGPPPPPDILHRSDGVPLLYRGRLNFAFGPPESAKSWFAQLACVELFEAGRSFLYVDVENELPETISHFGYLGVDALEMKKSGRAMFTNPTAPWSERAQKIIIDAVDRCPDFVIVDGMTGAMGLLGRSPDSGSDFSHFELEFLRPLMRTGAGVLCIDHTPKHSDGRPTIIGTQHKKAATTGVAYYFNAITKPGRGKEGLVNVQAHKDKGGYLRQYCDENDNIAQLVFTPVGNRVLLELRPMKVARNRPTAIMEAVSRYAEEHPGCTRRELLKSTNSRDRAVVAVGVSYLFKENKLRFDDNGGVAVNIPFRCVDDLSAEQSELDQSRWDG